MTPKEQNKIIINVGEGKFIPEGDKYSIHAKIGSRGGSVHIYERIIDENENIKYIKKLSLYIRPNSHTMIEPTEESDELYLGAKLKELSNKEVVRGYDICTILNVDKDNTGVFTITWRSVFSKHKSYLEMKVKNIESVHGINILLCKAFDGILYDSIIDRLCHLTIKYL